MIAPAATRLRAPMTTPAPMQADGATDALASTRAAASIPGDGSHGRDESGNRCKTMSMNAARTSSTTISV
jgi:hypothetical protein